MYLLVCLCVCVCVYIYICVYLCICIHIYINVTWTCCCGRASARRSRAWYLQSLRRNCRQDSVLVRWFCWPLSVCAYVYIQICVCICLYFYIDFHMDLPLWAHNCSEFLVSCSCNYFAVTSDKGPCVVDRAAGLPLCVCVRVYMYIHIHK
jgi:hypothetical protein